MEHGPGANGGFKKELEEDRCFNPYANPVMKEMTTEETGIVSGQRAVAHGSDLYLDTVVVVLYLLFVFAQSISNLRHG